MTDKPQRKSEVEKLREKLAKAEAKAKRKEMLADMAGEASHAAKLIRVGGLREAYDILAPLANTLATMFSDDDQ